MFQDTLLRHKSGKYLMGLGSMLMTIPILTIAFGSALLDNLSDAVAIPVYLISAIMAGMSIVFNVTGLKRYRAVQQEKNT